MQALWPGKASQGNPSGHGNGHGQLNGGRLHPAQKPSAGRTRHVGSDSVVPTLGTEASAQLRDRLIGEVNELGSSDKATTWAHRSLTEKNRLEIFDTQIHFDVKLASDVACGFCGIPQQV